MMVIMTMISGRERKLERGECDGFIERHGSIQEAHKHPEAQHISSPLPSSFPSLITYQIEQPLVYLGSRMDHHLSLG